MTSESQVIEVSDTTPPSFTINPDETVQCGEEFDLVGFDNLLDNCTPFPTMDIDSVFAPACGNSGVWTITYTASDDCDNMSSQTQTITIIDTTAPEFIDPPADITAECDDVPAATAVMAMDNCGEVTIDFSEVEFSGGCQGVIERTWVATDECDNSVTHIQYINLIDTTAPVLVGIPADLTIDCDEDYVAPTVTATDNCDEVDVVVTSEIIENCGNTFVKTYTFTATDECLNSTSGTWTVTSVDNEAPVLVVAPNAQVECGMEFDLVEIISVTDNCQDVTTSIDSVFVGDCGNTGVWTITYTATDECDNSTVETQTITIVDTTAPMLSVAPDASFECDVTFDVVDYDASDICGDVSVEVDSVFDADCGETGVWTLTYTATDACDNQTVATQTVTIIDTTAPVIVMPAVTEAALTCSEFTCDYGTLVEYVDGDLSQADAADFRQCVSQLFMANGLVPTAVEDNCDDVQWDENEFGIELLDCEDYNNVINAKAVITCYFVAEDDCGNEADMTQTSIVIFDTTAPEFVNAPEDITAECDDIPAATDVMATDDCGMVDVDFSEVEFSGGCQGVIERTWVATDMCGNSVTHIQYINLIDTTAPVLVGIPADLTIDCDEDYVAPTVTATDNCDEVDVVVTSEIIENCGNTFVKTYTFTATDECLNSTSGTWTVTSVDNEAPVLVVAPNAQVECGMEFDLVEIISVTDNCQDVTTSIDSVFVGDCGNTGVWTITYTATDECDNSTVETQTITIVDTTAPMLSVAPDASFECGVAFDVVDYDASDICGDVTVEVDSVFDAACGATGVWTLTYTATDACDNQTVATQTVTIVDNTAPLLSIAPDASFECGVAFDVVDFDASDICGDVSVEVDSVFDAACGNTGVWTLTYTATDACDNQTVATQTVTIVDNTAPEFVNAPEDITAECDDIPAATDVMATDICGEVTIDFSEVEFSGGCQGVIERTWVATDECDNSVTHIQYINLIDTTAPVLVGIPADLTIDCDEDYVAPTVTATDNCDEVDVVVTSEIIENCGNTFVKTYTFTATDECLNSTSGTWTVTSVDNEAPVLVVAPNAQVECGMEFDLVEIISVTDNCQDVTTSIDSVFVGDCGNTGVWTITYTATDECDNSTVETQTITIVDTTAPMLSVAPDASFECDVTFDVVDYDASDICGDVSVEVDSVFDADCGETGVWTLTYTATDACDNQTVATQTVTIIDTTAPVIVMPAVTEAALTCSEFTCDYGTLVEYVDGDLSQADAADFRQCVSQLFMANGLVPTAVEDNCDDVQWDENEFGIELLDCEDYNNVINAKAVITCYFVAEDDCGNEADMTQTSIVIFDTTAPEFVNAPEDITAECDDIPAATDVMATDDCGMVDVDFSEVEFSGGCQGVIERTWVATDMCGNSVTHIQYINLIDTTAPVLVGIPADLTIDCDEDYVAPTVTATDNCDEVDVVVTSEIIENCGNTFVKTYTFTATDECLNSTSGTWTVTSVDNEAPVLVVAPNAQVECGMEFDLVEIISVTDNCQDVTTSIDSVFVGDCGNTGVWTITYTATDECDNSTVETQTITIVDTTAPMLSVAPDASFECGVAFDVVDYDASDICGDVTVEVDSVFDAACGATGVWTLTYTATDACDNQTVATQTVTIVDNTAPLLSIAPDASFECGVAFDVVDFDASDICGDVSVEVDSVFDAACGNTGVWTLTYTATDECDNQTVATQTVTIIDTTAPEFVNAPGTITAECDDVPAADELMATDNCGEVTIEFNEVEFSGGCAGVLERTWIATDECNNSVTHVQFVNLVDETAPVLSGVPADMMMECTEDYEVATVTAMDNCDDDVTVSSSVETIGEGCEYEIVITWTATDECNNTVSDSQTITVVDTQAPVFDAVNDDMNVDCTMIPAADTLTATDACNTATVSMEETTSGQCPLVITRTYTASDNCGNSVEHVQTITVIDEDAPELSSYPADMMADCANVPAAMTLTAMDNCDDNVEVMFNETQNGEGCTYTITRIWTAMDVCGNTESHTQTVTVTDTTAPMFDMSTVPADATVECDAIPVAAMPMASDDCQDDADVTVSLMETEDGGQCDGEKFITRTWTATDGCGNESSVSQNIIVVDNTAPEFDFEPADEEYTCGDDIPAAPQVTATDACSSEVTVTLEADTVGNTNPNKDCVMTTGDPFSGERWSMFLTVDGENQYFVLEDDARFEEIDLGGGMMEAHITGTVVSESDSNLAWDIDVYLINKADYTEWTSQLTVTPPFTNRQPKDFLGLANPGDELGWEYWEVDNTRSQLIGIRDFAGDIINISHAPASKLFGFQVGMNANGYNTGFGVGGWFLYNGTIDGVAVNGQGDLAFDADCPPCEYTITRVWTAEDDCGNENVITQIIQVNAPEMAPVQPDNEEALIVRDAEVYGFVNSYPNPTRERSTLVYQVPVDGNVMIEVTDANGKVMGVVYNGQALAGADNYAEFDGSTFDNGLYIVRLISNNNVYFQKVMLNK